MTTQRKALQSQQIQELSRKCGVEILAHHYLRPEIKALAHFVGGTSQLIEQAARVSRKNIMVCGVDFISDHIRQTCPDKTVLTPRKDASCPYAQTFTPEELYVLKMRRPEAILVADLKAAPEIRQMADVEISPDTAEVILPGFFGRPLIMVPGPQLADLYGYGHLVINRKPEAVCAVHELATAEDFLAAREEHPKAVTVANYLCRPAVREMADFVGDSGAIIDFCRNTAAREFIIIGEASLAESLRCLMPEKTFHESEAEMYCPSMKLTSLKAVLECLEEFAGADEQIKKPAMPHSQPESAKRAAAGGVAGH